LSTPFLSIVIPAHNEENRLPRTLRQIFSFLEKQNYSAEVVIVENGSRDHTLEIARKFSAEYPNLTVLKEDQPGKGNAVRRGILDASGEYCFICDADLSMPIDEINKFIPPLLQGFDVAIGSREAPGAIRFNEPAYRHMGGRAINLLIQMFILPGLNDTQCGFKCFRAAIAKDLFQKQALSGWSFDIEVLYLARRRKYEIREIPIQWYYDQESKVSALRDALLMISDIFRIHLNAMRGWYDL